MHYVALLKDLKEHICCCEQNIQSCFPPRSDLEFTFLLLFIFSLVMVTFFLHTFIYLPVIKLIFFLHLLLQLFVKVSDFFISECIFSLLVNCTFIYHFMDIKFERNMGLYEL